MVSIKCCNSPFPFQKLNSNKLFRLFHDQAYCNAGTDKNFLIFKPQYLPHFSMNSITLCKIETTIMKNC